MSNEPGFLTPEEAAIPEQPPTETPEEPVLPVRDDHEEPVEDLPEDLFLSSLFRSDTIETDEDDTPSLPAWLRNLIETLRESRRAVLLCFGAALLVCILCILLIGGRRVTGRIERVLRYTGDQTVFPIDIHSSNSYQSFRNGLAVASADGLQCFNANGEQTALSQCQMDNPVLLQNGTLAMGYGIGGSSICVIHHAKGEQLNLTLPGAIIDADLSGSGHICCACSEKGYKTVLDVYDPHGTKIYSWLSSTQFFGQCAISPRGTTICAVALGIDDSGFASSAVTFATDREAPVAERPLGGDLVYDLSYVGAHTVCAVGETALHFFDDDSEEATVFSYEGGELLAYDLDADGFVAIVRNMNQAGSRFRITTVSTGGKELASISLDEKIQDISANGQYLAVLTASGLQVYDRRLRLCLSEDDIGFATRVCVQPDGAALLIDGSSAHRVS